MADTIHFIPMLGVGLYWWFARGRPIGLLWALLSVVIPNGLMELATNGHFNDPVFAWGGPLAMLVVGWKLPPKRAKYSRTCPFCAEVIKAEAVVCRYCGKDVPTSPAPVAAMPPPVPAPAVPARPQEQFCSACDTKVDSTAKLCPKCGCGAFCDTSCA